jgi:hypothetical protein
MRSSASGLPWPFWSWDTDPSAVVAVDARQGSGRPPRTTVFSKTAGPVADDHGRDRRAEEDTVTDVLDAAADFVWRTGRLIDRHRFAHQFLGGDRAPVLAALAAYRNPDGGLGNALEPDLRGPASQPETLEVAFWVLDGVDAMDDPMVTAACDWLVGASTAEGGVPFVLPSVLEHPPAAEGEVHGPLEFAPAWVTVHNLGVLRSYGRLG